MQPLTTPVSKGVNLSMLMLNLSVSVHAAVAEDKDARNKIVCTAGHEATPVRQSMACPACGGTHGFEKARIVGDGLVVIPAEVLAAEAAQGEAFKKNIAITVHPAAEVSATMMPSGKSYYLSLAAEGGAAAYRLLAATVLSRTDLAFMTKMTLRTATSLFMLTVAGDGTLVLRQCAEAGLVRTAPVIPAVELNERALALVSELADQQLTPFLVEEHGSGARSIVAEYASTQTPITISTPGTPAETGTVTDMTTALEAMVAAGRKPSTPAKKAVARRASATKSVARKTAAKKAS